MDSRRVIVDENDVTFENATSYDAGFQLEGGDRSRLFCNYVEGTDITNNQFGYVLDGAPENFLVCNSADEVRYGLTFIGNNNATEIQGHDFFTHHFALQGGTSQFRPSGYTGVQEHNGNRWRDEPYAGAGYKHYNSEVEFDINNSVHVYDENDNGTGNLDSDTDPTDVDLFRNESGNTYTCASETTGCPPDAANFGGGINDTDKAIAQGNFSAEIYESEQEWTAKRHLYRRLLRDTTLVVPNTVIDTFYNDESSTTVGKFEELRADIEALFEVNSLTLDSMVLDDSLLRVRYEELMDVVFELDTATDQSLKDSLLLVKQSKETEIDSLTTVQANRESALESTRSSTASSLLIENGNISTTHIYEDNQADFNEVFLDIIADGQDTLTDAQVSTLSSIADQCPYKGGDAVFQARALLGDGAPYDDDALCDTSSRSFILPREEKPLGFLVSPNPSSSFLKVELDKEADSKGRLILVNTYGTVLKEQFFEKGIQVLFVIMDDVPSGTYYLTVETQTNKETQVISNLK
jgi:hypothetical protein